MGNFMPKNNLYYITFASMAFVSARLYCRTFTSNFTDMSIEDLDKALL